MKNLTFVFIIVIMILSVGGFVFVRSESYETNSNSINDQQILEGQLQKIKLSMKNYNYYPEIIKVKANQPVEITLDESVRGCLRALTIKDFGVSKYLRTPEDKIVFNPIKKGEFRFSCSMGMGYGKLIVE